MTSRFPPFAFVELVSPYNKKNITRWHEDMNFMFEWQEQYLTSEGSERVRYCSCHSNIKFISSSHRVISSIYDLNKWYSFYTMCNWIMWSSLKPAALSSIFSPKNPCLWLERKHANSGPGTFWQKITVANHNRSYQFPETRIQALRNSFSGHILKASVQYTVCLISSLFFFMFRPCKGY